MNWQIADHVYFFFAAALEARSPGSVILRELWLESLNLADPVLVVDLPRLDISETHL